MSRPLTTPQKAIVAAGIASAVVWAVPVIQVLLLPLIYLNTHLHELCHALAALGTGGSVSRILVFDTGGGLTYSYLYGWLPQVLVASAGYVGAAILGTAMIVFGRNQKSARNILWGSSAVLFLALLIWIRGDWIGVMSAASWAVVLWAMGRYLKVDAPVYAVQFLGLQQCLNALQSLYTLLHISAFTGGSSDAAILQRLTGVPALIWALGWIAFSLLMIFMAFRHAWRGGSLRLRP